MQNSRKDLANVAPRQAVFRGERERPWSPNCFTLPLGGSSPPSADEGREDCDKVAERPSPENERSSFPTLPRAGG